jgi:hypothetical protein
MFVKVTNGQIDQYPYTVGDLRRDNPNTSFPKNVPAPTMAAYGMFNVGYEAAPEYDQMTHRLQHSSQPELVDGKWVLTKTVVALTPEQVADRDAAKGKEVRSKRDKMIADTDWMALSDNTLTAEWATYRQALRDITDHVNFPYLADEDWPVKPV